MKKYLSYIIICIILIPLSVNASEGVIINCPDNIIKNEDFDCEVIGEAPYAVSAIEYEFSLPDYLTKKDFSVDPSWEGDEEDNLVLLYTDENKKSPFNIGVITLSSSKDIDEVDIKTLYLLFGDEDYNEHLLVEKVEDVKDMESKEKKSENEENNIVMYVIIILIVLMLFIVAFILRKKRVKR